RREPWSQRLSHIRWDRAAVAQRQRQPAREGPAGRAGGFPALWPAVRRPLGLQACLVLRRGSVPQDRRTGLAYALASGHLVSALGRRTSGQCVDQLRSRPQAECAGDHSRLSQGSSLRRNYLPRSERSDPTPLWRRRSASPSLDIEAQRKLDPNAYDIRSWATEPRDVVVF